MRLSSDLHAPMDWFHFAQITSSRKKIFYTMCMRVVSAHFVKCVILVGIIF